MSKANEVKGQMLRSKVNEKSLKISFFANNFCQKWPTAIKFGEKIRNKQNNNKKTPGWKVKW